MKRTLITATLLSTLKLDAAKDKEPPKEFRLFAFGTLETSKGDFLFDEAAATAVMAAYKDDGRELCFDYEHAMLSDPPPADGAPAAGWFVPEVREDGLWATNVRWTPQADEYLRNAEYRHFSPAFRADGKERRIKKLVNVALTNIPASKDQEPLVAASARARDRRATKLSAAMSFDQIRSALQEALRRMLAADGLYGWVCDVYDDTFVYCVGDDLFQAPYLVEGSDAVIGEPTEVQRTYTPIVDNDDAQETKMKNLLTALSLKDNATEAEALVALTALKKSHEDAEAEVIKLTGAKSRSEAIGTIAAWKASHEQVTQLSAKVKELGDAALTREVDQLVADGTRDGKIPPAMKDWATDLGKKDIVALKSFLEKAPKLVTTTATGGQKPNENETTLVVLTADEKDIARKMNISEKDYLESKKRHLERATVTA